MLSVIPSVTPPIVLAPIAIPVVVPTVIVFESSTIAIPIPTIEALSFVSRAYPARTSIGRSSPVSIVPTIAVAGCIPVAVYPIEIGSRSRWPVPNDTRRRWRANSDSNGNLAEHASGGQ